jgi:RNA polymerase sigma factor (sigma-70 family)
MQGEAGGAVVREFQQLLEPGTVTGLTERQLLARFVESGDPVAFEAIVRRHGPMVYTVCRQTLRDANDVDDAFQATFLLLIRKASALRQPDRIGPWLYGVAFRVAHRARVKPKPGPLPDDCPAQLCDCPTDERERLEAIHDEIDRLPENYRLPVILCCLEGKSHEEAARQLGWPVGTVHGRLSRARARLRTRLERRDVTWRTRSVEALGLLQPVRIPVPQTLQHATVALLTGPVGPRLQFLASGGLTAMIINYLKTIALSVGLAAVGVVAAASALFAYQRPASERTAIAARPAAQAAETTKQVTPDAVGKASLKAPADLFADENEKAWGDLEQLQVKAELLEMDVDSERSIIVRRKQSLASLFPTGTGRALSEKESADSSKQVEADFARIYAGVAKLEEVYRRHRLELAQLKRRISRMSNGLGIPTMFQPNPSDTVVGYRLDRLEQKVDQLIERLPAKRP